MTVSLAAVPLAGTVNVMADDTQTVTFFPTADGKLSISGKVFYGSLIDDNGYNHLCWVIGDYSDGIVELQQSSPATKGTINDPDTWFGTLRDHMSGPELKSLSKANISADASKDIDIASAVVKDTILLLKDTAVSDGLFYLPGNEECTSMNTLDDYYAGGTYWTRNSIEVQSRAAGDTTDYTKYHAAVTVGEDSPINTVALSASDDVGFLGACRLNIADRSKVLFASRDSASGPYYTYYLTLVDSTIDQPAIAGAHYTSAASGSTMTIQLESAVPTGYHLVCLDTENGAYTDAASDVVSVSTVTPVNSVVTVPVNSPSDHLYLMYEKNNSISNTTNYVSVPKEITADNSDISYTRLSGADRYETAAAIDRAACAAQTEAVLVSGEDFADALCASGFAGGLGCPVMLTDPDYIPDSTLKLINDLGIQYINIIGGTGAISQSVQDQLEAIGIHTSRFGGDNRQQTAEKVYERGLVAGASDSNMWGSECVVTTGIKAADALSVSPWCFARDMPIFLTGEDGTLTPESLAIALTFSKVYIIGGNGVVADSVEAQLNNTNTIRAFRIKGDDRYKTSVAVAKFFGTGSGSDFYYDGACFASGLDGHYPDALVGAILAGQRNVVDSNGLMRRKGAPIILVDGTSGPGFDFVTNILANTKMTRIDFFGGEGAVPTVTLDTIIFNWTNPVNK